MNKLNNKKKIITSSIKLFNKYGFENVTVNQIIEDSQTSKGTFYHYFKAKDELLVYVLDTNDDAIRKHMRSLPEGLRAYDKIKMIIRYILELYQNNNSEISSYNAKQIYHTQLVSNDKFLLKEDRYIFVLFSELVNTAIKDSEIRPELTTKEIVSTIMMLLRGMFFNWYLCETQFNVVEKGCYLIYLYMDDIRYRAID